MRFVTEVGIYFDGENVPVVDRQLIAFATLGTVTVLFAKAVVFVVAPTMFDDHDWDLAMGVIRPFVDSTDLGAGDSWHDESARVDVFRYSYRCFD